MSIKIDFSIMELLTSKICHDLISPIGAVNNGMEFVEEMGAESSEEVFELIGFSASQASAKLQAYRMAYGAGGLDDGIKPKDVYNFIEALISTDKKIVQNWDPHGELGYTERPKAYCKLLICALLLAMEALPKGGTISVKSGGKQQTLIHAEGKDAGLRDGMEDALNLNTSPDNLEPKHMHSYICGLIAKNYGYTLSVEKTGVDLIILSLNLPSS